MRFSEFLETFGVKEARIRWNLADPDNQQKSELEQTQSKEKTNATIASASNEAISKKTGAGKRKTDHFDISDAPETKEAPGRIQDKSAFYIGSSGEDIDSTTDLKEKKKKGNLKNRMTTETPISDNG